MKVVKRGGLKLRLDAGEAPILLSLLEELRVMVASDDADDPVRQRLYPAAYAEDGPADEFRELTETGLRDERVERIELCEAELTTGSDVVELADDAGDRWLRVLNDLRLALGTRIGVTDDWDHHVDPDDPTQFPQAAYVWLTGVQDALVRALM
ncbi:MAG: DUF2017 family protein [Jatrophihabitans sp.]|uniref:DUF2017 family protein n=1 Tax=Jatrophihabitans sp. TaxID=1932789 RepID=UPI003F7E80F5